MWRRNAAGTTTSRSWSSNHKGHQNSWVFYGLLPSVPCCSLLQLHGATMCQVTWRASDCCSRVSRLPKPRHRYQVPRVRSKERKGRKGNKTAKSEALWNPYWNPARASFQPALLGSGSFGFKMSQIAFTIFHQESKLESWWKFHQWTIFANRKRRDMPSSSGDHAALAGPAHPPGEVPRNVEEFNKETLRIRWGIC